MNPIATVSTELELGLVVPGGPSLPVLAFLRYSADDPWAVQVAFLTGGEGDGLIEWVFARHLLIAGLTSLVGEGDVQVWPAGRARAGVVHLAMASPSGAALFEIDRDDVLAFLQQTYDVVPPGSEEQAVDIDAALARLLASDA